MISAKTPANVASQSQCTLLGKHLLHELKRSWFGYLLLLPTILVFIIMKYYPIFYAIRMSFVEWIPGFDTINFVGLRNYKMVIEDPVMGKAVLNTFYFVAMTFIFGYAVPILVAIVVAEARRLQGYLRIVFYLPAILPALVIYQMWGMMYNPGEGLLNKLFALVGLPESQFLNGAATVMPSIVVISIWAGFGGAALLYAASLSSIDLELYRSAEIDGAGVLARIWYITIPSIRMMMLLMALSQLIATVQIFGEPWMLTSGGPNNASMTICLKAYQYAFQFFEFSAANAISIMLAIVLGIVSFVYFRLLRAQNILS